MIPNDQTELFALAGSSTSVSCGLLLAAINALNVKSSAKHSGAK
jgi:hypothetical protein